MDAFPLSLNTHTHTDRFITCSVKVFCYLLSRPQSLTASLRTHANWETASELWPGSAMGLQM